jgi:hypothetical protein
MRFNDEYKYFREEINFDIRLEDYISKYEIRQDIHEIKLEETFYSPRLFFDDKNDILITTKISEELKIKEIISFDISLLEKDKVFFEDVVIIEIKEDNLIIDKIQI